MNMRPCDLAALLLLVCFVPTPGCKGTDNAASPDSTAAAQTTTAVLFDGMGSHQRKVTTKSALAQQYFDQGLTWTFAFNHDEAIRSFTEVARQDPDCAMAQWGIALCNGPHINNPSMDEAHSKAAWDALQRALALRDKASAVERALIDALAARYAMPIPKDRAPLDKAYAAAMKPVSDANPQDADIATLYAESLMDLRPWDLWSKTGEPRPETPQVLAALERAMKIDAQHPGACHLYIHASEASPHPEQAEAAADRLRKLVPGSGHLVHMPAHIDVRTGKWEQAATCNINAMSSDAAYFKLSPKQGFYRLYMGHNADFLAFACMMEGRQAEALRAAQGMIAGVPADFLKTSGAIVDGLMTVDLEVLKRFGKWEDILRHAGPPKGLPVSNAMWHFHRGVAQAALGHVDEAEREEAEFRKAVKAVPEGTMMMINPAAKIFEIAQHVLAGEIAYRKGATDNAIKELQLGVAREDDLRYMEPPEWVTPVRHTLGAILLEAGKVDEAEDVYRTDLKYWPRNAWSLFGVAQCLKAKNAPGAAEAQQQFERAWARADTKITSSCLCVKAKT